jgi:hypothetical protein
VGKEQKNRVAIFRGSSVVEQVAVNDLVVGSNPTRGAHKSLSTSSDVFLLLVLPEKECSAVLFPGIISVTILVL